jgi:hypothetical protein
MDVAQVVLAGTTDDQAVGHSSLSVQGKAFSTSVVTNTDSRRPQASRRPRLGRRVTDGAAVHRWDDRFTWPRLVDEPNVALKTVRVALARVDRDS